MAKAVKKSIINSNAVEKTTDTSLSNLTKVCNDAVAAVEVKTKEAKKLATEIKRFSKKRAALMKRKKTATAKLKKDGGAESRKALKAVEKDIAQITKELNKLKPAKASVSEELVALKAGCKRVTAYVSAIEKADNILNKPVKKRKKAKKKPVISLVSTDPIADAA